MLEPDELRPEKLHRLSIADFERMVATGLFTDKRLELLDGLLVTMSPQGDDHARITAWFHEAMIRRLSATYEVRGHSPVIAKPRSEPEPDVAIYRRDPSRRRHYDAALLLVEVADDSLYKDLNLKTTIYARARMPDYWVIDVPHQRVHVFRDPVRGRYRRHDIVHGNAVVRALEVSFSIRVSSIPW